MKWGGFVIWFIILSSIRIPKYISQSIIEPISKVDGWFIQLALIILVFLILLFLSKIFKIIKKIFVNLKKEKRLKTAEKKIDRQKKKIEGLQEDKGSLAKTRKRIEEREALKQAAKDEIEGLGASDEG